MAYTIYFGYLPKSTLIVDRNDNIVKYSDLPNLEHVEISQITFTRNGGASFIIPQSQHKIDHMAFACYNAFFVKTLNIDDDGVYQGYSMTTYDITDISYSQATNVKITGVLSPYNLALSLNYSSGGTNTYMQWRNMEGFNGYVERGYKYDSVLDASKKINFSSNADTDLYCLPPFKIKKDIMKSSTRLKYNFVDPSISISDTVKDTTNKIFNSTLWELTYILPEGSCTDPYGGPAVLDYSLEETTAQPLNNTTKINQPYGIIFKPLNTTVYLDGKQYTFYLYNTYHSAYENWQTMYDAVVDQYKPYILSKQVSFLPPFIFDDIGDAITFNEVSTNNFHMEIDIGNTNSFVYLKKFDYFNGQTSDTPPVTIIDPAVLPCSRLTPYVYEAEANLLELTGFFFALSSFTYTNNDFIDIRYNPYVNLHCQELRLSDTLGNNYAYPLINLGTYSNYILHFKVYVGFNLGEINIYTTIDTSDLSKSVLNSDMTKDYRGLFTSYNNSVLFNEDLLKDFMAQNKNFYNIRRNNREAFFIQWGFNMYSSAMSSMSSMVNGNWIGAASNMGTSLASGTSSLVNYRTKIANEDLQLANLEGAPDKIVGQENDTLFYSNNRTFGIYLDLYIADGITKQALFKDFMLYGIYINRYVDNVNDYIHITSNTGERNYLKYFKGTLLLKPFSYNTVIGNTYVNSYLATDTCLRPLEKYLQDGCYILKENLTTFKPNDSSSELQIFNDYLNDISFNL